MGNTKLANPAPLGLMGFGMTTILLNLHNIGMFPMDGIIGDGHFYGGIAQIFAGLLEYKKGNTFGLTAFTSYGSFWLTLVAILLMPKMGWQGGKRPFRRVQDCGACSPCSCSSVPLRRTAHCNSSS